MNTDQTSLEQHVRSTLDDSVSGLDAETRSALTRMRSEALAQRRQHRWMAPSLWVPATAFSLAAVLTLTMLMRAPTDQPATWLAQAEDQTLIIDMLVTDDGLGVESDPAFYVWVEESLASEDTEHAG